MGCVPILFIIKERVTFTNFVILQDLTTYTYYNLIVIRQKAYKILLSLKNIRFLLINRNYYPLFFPFLPFEIGYFG